MDSAQVIAQLSSLFKLLLTILFNTRVGFFKVVGFHHVPLQVDLHSKLLSTSWLEASKRLFFQMKSFYMIVQRVFVTKCF